MWLLESADYHSIHMAGWNLIDVFASVNKWKSNQKIENGYRVQISIAKIWEIYLTEKCEIWYFNQKFGISIIAKLLFNLLS